MEQKKKPDVLLLILTLLTLLLLYNAEYMQHGSRRNLKNTAPTSC